MRSGPRLLWSDTVQRILMVSSKRRYPRYRSPVVIAAYARHAHFSGLQAFLSRLWFNGRSRRFDETSQSGTYDQ